MRGAEDEQRRRGLEEEGKGRGEEEKRGESRRELEGGDLVNTLQAALAHSPETPLLQ